MIGVLQGQGKFYIKPEKGGIKTYEVGDIVEEYGRVIKIEDGEIYTEKGLIRKKEK